MSSTPREKRELNRQDRIVLGILSVLSFMTAMNSTMVVTALPTISAALPGEATESFWVGTSYLVGSAVFQPFLAALSDVFGRVEVLYPSILLFTAGTIVAALAHNYTELITGRVIQGIGAGGIMALAIVIYSDMVPSKQRSKHYGFIQAAWAAGTVLGPLIGGLFGNTGAWRWVFYISLPFCGLGLITVPFMIKLKPKNITLLEKLAKVDFVGGVLFVAGLILFLAATSWAGSQSSWMSYRSVVPLVLGVVFLAAAFAWERYGANEPFLRHALFYWRTARISYFCALVQGLMVSDKIVPYPRASHPSDS